MEENFWSFWPGDSFDKDGWQTAYDKAREKLRKAKRSRTREKLKQITDAFPGDCLETNLYWTPTDSEDELKDLIQKGCVTLKPFFHLLKAISPRIVIGHGRRVIAQRDAIEFIAPAVRFLATERHFRSISPESIAELIRRIEEQLRTFS